MQDRYKMWADEVSKCFGGLDIFAIDVLKTQDGKEYILEINDTACGLMWEHEQEDCGRIRDLVLAKMNASN
jgi:glutathione synthase/RimK-type ligase-like ATP-grasp enzyme